jgi:hypothetical protein
MVYTEREAKAIAKTMSKYLEGEMIFVLYVEPVGFAPFTADLVKAKETKKKIYHAERVTNTVNSDASVLGGVQGGSKGKGKKVRKKHSLSVKSDASFVGTDDYFRWLSEVSRYFNRE